MASIDSGHVEDDTKITMFIYKCDRTRHDKRSIFHKALAITFFTKRFTFKQQLTEIYGTV